MKYKRDEINELLIDYLENDLAEGLKNDLNLVVRNSPARNKSLRAFEETKKIVKSAEPNLPNLSDSFFDQLHEKVMADISQLKPRSRVSLWFGEQSWRSIAAVAVMVLVSGALFFTLFKPSLTFKSAGTEKTGDMLLSISVKVPEAFSSSLLNDRDEADFFMDAMAEKVAQLEEKNASNLINEIGNTQTQ
jgi:hypothetical protein